MIIVRTVGIPITFGKAETGEWCDSISDRRMLFGMAPFCDHSVQNIA
jgi:hypothetical protein